MTTTKGQHERRDYIASLVRPLARVGMGIPYYSHPIHAATVHLPIGLLSLSYLMDSVQVIPRLAQGLTWLKIFPPAAAVNTLSHYLGAGGLLFSIPTVLTGLSELFGLWDKQVKQKDSIEQTIDDAAKEPPPDVSGEKLRIVLRHAGINSAVLGLGVWNWWVRRTDRDLVLPQMNAWFSLFALPAIFYSASLGGELVYKYGMGVKRQGSAKQIESRERKGEK
ncbi:DUF2231 domain-containing protein [Sporobolomyces salmoneus]|uniref:DUF2231 domain-containing protein n=1 Tax=Sporobolomyces salmoneus TaxID=183962 RepID=UPI00317593AB